MTVSNDLTAQVLGSVPIPSVPGASLTFEITGGNLITTFQGTCAEAADGFGQYTGETSDADCNVGEICDQGACQS